MVTSMCAVSWMTLSCAAVYVWLIFSGYACRSVISDFEHSRCHTCAQSASNTSAHQLLISSDSSTTPASRFLV